MGSVPINIHTDENIEYLTQILQDAVKTEERKNMKPVCSNNSLSYLYSHYETCKRNEETF